MHKGKPHGPTSILKSMAGAGALCTARRPCTPAISHRAAARSLRLCPQAAGYSTPIWGTQSSSARLPAWCGDTLYGVDENLRRSVPQKKEMVEGEEASADGLTWTFRLRPG